LVMEDEEQLCRYLLAELDGIDFTTPVYQDILQLFRTELQEGRLPDVQALLHHPSSSVRETVAHLISRRYELSDVWETRHKIPIPREEDRLDKAVFQNVVRVKLRLVQKLIAENLERLKQAEEAALLEAMQVHQELKKTEMELARFLGTVISK
jgi:DNA primase